jgi:ubiquinone/menaquinone biosynthesis C-methylase UbiE
VNTDTEYWLSVYDRPDFLGNCYRQRLHKTLSWLDNFRVSENTLLLDAGCGAGIPTQEMARKGFHVVALDCSRAMIRKAQSVCEAKLKRKIQFVQGDLECLPFSSSSFEIVICLGVITYSHSVDKTLSEISRVLSPSGMLILSVVNKAHLAHYLDIPKFVKLRLTKTVGRTISRLCHSILKVPNTGIRSFFIPEIKGALARERFIVLEYSTVPLGLLTFGDRNIPPVALNVKISMLLGKASSIPIIGSFGGMCIIKAVKGQ